MRSRHSTNEPSQRQLRAGEQIRHIVAETMRRGHFHNEALMDAGHITVTEVRVSPDLKNATAYVMSLGGLDMEKILPALNDAAPVFQKDIGRNVTFKFTPRIRFVKDESFDEANRIEEILRDLNPGGDKE
jgi:ribosome-binding factor A